ncbi:uncharacterized protein K444DRAFT_72546 [Hyaloscypha bicolor E]|uniref:Uncharacterized protein n=1 Tax=Hyaloscypha bicolor E TaxID=1095630 RepID=A0A2J6SZ51_9HELO|nr:uncharacterized protein K444DRAFT_72546 [Hyaloscypha bicolor E]PMD56051.1 hypothetical protein K444DRAFT_72546 [Hyaloscypha bicolor E]
MRRSSCSGSSRFPVKLLPPPLLAFCLTEGLQTEGFLPPITEGVHIEYASEGERCMNCILPRRVVLEPRKERTVRRAFTGARFRASCIREPMLS